MKKVKDVIELLAINKYDNVKDSIIIEDKEDNILYDDRAEWLLNALEDIEDGENDSFYSKYYWLLDLELSDCYFGSQEKKFYNVSMVVEQSVNEEKLRMYYVKIEYRNHLNVDFNREEKLNFVCKNVNELELAIYKYIRSKNYLDVSMGVTSTNTSILNEVIL